MNTEEHLLACLAEECAEISEQCARVAVRASKALRFGATEVQPGQLHTNVQRLSAELGELLAVAEMLEATGVIARASLERKKDRVRAFMAYAVRCGALVDGQPPDS